MEYFTPYSRKQLLCIYGEFNADEESVKNDVEYLIEWMSQEPSLPSIRDEEILITFLLRGKFNLERTKELIQRYYISRALMPYLYQNRDPCDEAIRKTFEISAYVPMQHLTPDCYRVVCFKIAKHTVKDIPTSENILRVQRMAADIAMKFDRNKGIIVVFDVQYISAAYIHSVIVILTKLVELLLKITPFRIHKIYVLHMMPIAETVLNLAKIVMKKKIFDRIEFWNHLDHELATVIPKECLPSEYGGTGKSLKEAFEEWLAFIQSKKDWLTCEENIKADLSKKSIDQGFHDNDFGVEGSFRKIRLD